MADVTLTLGDVTFTDLEIPERIPFGGDQQLVTHKLVGGQRTVDAMGQDEAPIEWSGWILGPDAVARAQSIDAMRVSGLPQTLTWSGFSYQVIVKTFAPVFERFYQIPYRIVCEVVSNDTQPVTASATPPIDQAVATDNATCDSLVQSAGDPTLSSLMGNVDDLITAAGTISTAAQSVINAIQQGVQAAQGQAAALVATVTEVLGTPATFGGVTAGIAATVSIAALNASTANTMQLWTLMQLQGNLGRLMANLAAVNSSPNVVMTAGGNLFQIAQEQYGDPTDWPAIAAANGLTDPFIQGLNTLTIPPQPGNSGGILDA